MAIKRFPEDGAQFSNFFGSSSPEVLYVGFNEEYRWSYDSHTHDEYSELLFITEGECSYTISGKEYTAQKGDFVVFNKNVPHTERSNPSMALHFYFCGIANLSLAGACPGFILPPDIKPVVHAQKNTKKIVSYFNELMDEFDNQYLGYDIICQNLAKSLVLLIHRLIGEKEQEKHPVHNEPLSARVKEYIDKNYSKNLSRATLADALYISPYYIAHLFKNDMGMSPINYIIQKRITEAQTLLLHTDKPLGEVAAMVGYENPSYFAYLFKKTTGMSPSKFRGARKGKKE